MGTNIFINLPVKDIKRSVTFFSRIGYNFNPEFSDENAKCLIISDNIFVMLLAEPFFRTFTKKEIADTSDTTETILTLTYDSREKVDEFIDKTILAGGTEVMPPMDQDGMYGRTFEDPDGHLWEAFYMDTSQVAAYPETEQVPVHDQG